MTAKQWNEKILAGTVPNKDFTGNRRQRRANQKYQHNAGYWSKLQYYNRQQDERIATSLAEDKG